MKIKTKGKVEFNHNGETLLEALKITDEEVEKFDEYLEKFLNEQSTEEIPPNVLLLILFIVGHIFIFPDFLVSENTVSFMKWILSVFYESNEGEVNVPDVIELEEADLDFVIVKPDVLDYVSEMEKILWGNLKTSERIAVAYENFGYEGICFLSFIVAGVRIYGASCAIFSNGVIEDFLENFPNKNKST